MKKNNPNPIPARTIERVVLYNRILSDLEAKGVRMLFSHQLAELAHNTSTQVRRDLMEIGCIGSPRRGYNVSELIQSISKLLGGSRERIIALVGVGNLGRAVLSYFTYKRHGLSIAAAFDTDERLVNRVISGCRCYHLDRFDELMQEKQFNLGIITVPADAAQSVADWMTGAGIRGILNFAPVTLSVPEGVFVDRLDIASTLEKLAYFTGSN